MLRSVLLVPLLALPLQTDTSDRPSTDALEQLIAEHTEQYNFSGTILIEKEGAIVHDASYGLANRTFDVPNAADTRYKVASITKAFTATLVLQLVEDGLLDLDAPVASYLPDYTGEGADRVTLHHLLRHTSGRRNIESFGVRMFEKPWLDVYGSPFPMERIVDEFCSGPLDAEPGEEFDYDNGEFLVLGAIVEAVTGGPFEDALRERILDPLGLEGTGMLDHARVVPGLASTYRWDREAQQLIHDRPMFIQNWGAAGAMYSCAPDIRRFLDALFAHELISEQSLERMLTPGLDDYGYGLWVREIGEGEGKVRYAIRYGRIRGANAVIVRYLSHDATIIILANTTRTEVGYFASRIHSVLIDG